jgi:hypothetical protein
MAVLELQVLNENEQWPNRSESLETSNNRKAERKQLGNQVDKKVVSNAATNSASVSKEVSVRKVVVVGDSPVRGGLSNHEARRSPRPGFRVSFGTMA